MTILDDRIHANRPTGLDLDVEMGRALGEAKRLRRLLAERKNAGGKAG